MDTDSQVTLEGRVLDDKTGLPVETFTVSDLGDFKMGEKGSGRFSNSQMTAGVRHSIRIKADGYVEL